MKERHERFQSQQNKHGESNSRHKGAQGSNQLPLRQHIYGSFIIFIYNLHYFFFGCPSPGIAQARRLAACWAHPWTGPGEKEPGEAEEGGKLVASKNRKGGAGVEEIAEEELAVVTKGGIGDAVEKAMLTYDGCC